VTKYLSPGPNVVEGEDGVRVEVLGRTGIRYTESSRSCFVDSEVLASAAIAVYVKGIRGWDPPHDDDPLTDDDRRRILENITDAFRPQQWEVELVDNADLVRWLKRDQE
jgi:hypothetical protein